jgi:hypothetical protein
VEVEQGLRRRIAALPRSVRKRIDETCFERGVTYDVAPGKRVAIALLPSPSILTSTELRFLHALSERINAYLRRMPALYEAHAEARELLPFPEVERVFVESCFGPGEQTIVSRNDLDMYARGETVAFEPNGCSIGGIHYSSASTGVIDDIVMRDPAVGWTKRHAPLTSASLVAAKLVERHAKKLTSKRRLSIGILENREWDTGITEMPSFASFLEARGHRPVIGDPRTLARVRGGYRLEGAQVDVLYRNMEVTDFVELEAAGARLRALRAAFRDNIVVSGIAGDFDHKSVWELLTSKRTEHMVRKPDRALFRKHLLWTRLFREAETEGPDGSTIDLVPFVARHRAEIVLKPNQSCGGDRILIGRYMSDRTWQRTIREALSGKESWVAQRFHPGTQKAFPKIGAKKLERYYITYGVISAPFGFGILGRACGRPIVNVSRGGGLVALFRLG